MIALICGANVVTKVFVTFIISILIFNKYNILRCLYISILFPFYFFFHTLFFFVLLLLAPSSIINS